MTVSACLCVSLSLGLVSYKYKYYKYQHLYKTIQRNFEWGYWHSVFVC